MTINESAPLLAADQGEGRCFYRPREFARAVGLSAEQVYGMLHRGDLRHLRTGNRFLIPVAERERLIACQPLLDLMNRAPSRWGRNFEAGRRVLAQDERNEGGSVEDAAL